MAELVLKRDPTQVAPKEIGKITIHPAWLEGEPRFSAWFTASWRCPCQKRRINMLSCNPAISGISDGPVPCHGDWFKYHHEYQRRASWTSSKRSSHWVYATQCQEAL